MNSKFDYFYKTALIILLLIIAINSFTISRELHDIGRKLFDLTDVLSVLSEKQ